MNRLTKKEKQSIFDFLKGDKDSYIVGIEMAKSYLKEYPNEKSFKRKVKKLKRESPYNMKNYSWYKYDILKDTGVLIKNPVNFGLIRYENS